MCAGSVKYEPRQKMRTGAVVKKILIQYPIILGLIASIVSLILLRKFGEPALDEIRQFLSMIVDVSAIAVGFLAATMSILLSIESSNAVQQHKEAGTYRGIINCLSAACTTCFLLAILSLSLVILEMAKIKTGNFRMALIVIWCGLLISAGLYCYRVIMLFGKILRRSAGQ